MHRYCFIIGVIFFGLFHSAVAQERSGIVDIWVMTHMNGNPVKVPSGLKQPYLEFQSEKNRMMGHSGCNSLQSTYSLFENDSIAFEPIISTRMMCNDMSYEDEFLGNLGNVKYWKVRYNRLELFDASGNEVIRLKKVD
jgi:heat shock protein HslJ